MAKIRINKYLAQLGLSSRRGADELIAQGIVEINDEEAKMGQSIDPEHDLIKVKGKLINSLEADSEPKEYWKVYKPVGVVSTANDPSGRPAVTSLVESKVRLYPVGRLDQDSEGLILLTNDGDLTYRLTHPKFQVPKEYLVWLEGKLTDSDVRHLQRGVMVGGRRTKRSVAEIIFRETRQAKLRIVITEGRNRQIRKMIRAIKLNVIRLKRVGLGTLKINKMEAGEAKPLTDQELKDLKKTRFAG